MFSVFSYAQQPASSSVDATTSQTEQPALKIQDEHDFGKIPQGKPVHYPFEVTNIGTDPLKIINVQASCGCTTPEWEKDKSVATGGTTVINVGYNAATEGPFNKTITITYNNNKTKVIRIKGNVWKAPATSAPENKALSELKN